MRLRISIAAVLILFLAACGSSNNPASPNGSVTVVISPGASLLTTTAFGVNPLVVAVGHTVVWSNTDSMAHTSTSDTGVWSSGQIAPGATYSYTFQVAGTYTYHCTNHPGMAGVIIAQ